MDVLTPDKAPELTLVPSASADVLGMVDDLSGHAEEARIGYNSCAGVSILQQDGR